MSISYWLDLITNNIYKVDEDSSNGMSLLNDESLNLKKITKQDYSTRKGE